MSGLNWFVERLKEPSTYAGLSMLVGVLGLHVTPEAYQAAVPVVAAASAFLAVVFPESEK